MPPDWPVDGEGDPLTIPGYVAREIVPTGALPFIFGVVSRYGDGSLGIGAYTSELGQFPTSNALNQLRLITGFHGWSNGYRAFRKPPDIRFLTGADGQFMYRRYLMTWAFGANTINYPHVLLGVVFVRNKTAHSIQRSMNVGGSSRGYAYGGCGVKALTPNALDGEPVTALTEANLWGYAGNSHNAQASVTVTLPANKTVAIIFRNIPF